MHCMICQNQIRVVLFYVSSYVYIVELRAYLIYIRYTIVFRVSPRKYGYPLLYFLLSFISLQNLIIYTYKDSLNDHVIQFTLHDLTLSVIALSSYLNAFYVFLFIILLQLIPFLLQFQKIEQFINYHLHIDKNHEEQFMSHPDIFINLQFFLELLGRLRYLCNQIAIYRMFDVELPATSDHVHYLFSMAIIIFRLSNLGLGFISIIYNEIQIVVCFCSLLLINYQCLLCL